MEIVALCAVILLFLLYANAVRRESRPMDPEVTFCASYVRDRQELTRRLVEAHYNLEDRVYVVLPIRIFPQEVLDILVDRRKFEFGSKASCQVSTTTSGHSVRSTVSIDLAYTQGFKIFAAVLRPTLIDELSEQDRQVHEKIVQQSGKMINPSMVTIDKARIVHDFLIATSRFDYENYKNGTVPDESFTPYGLLFKNVAVCQAYAETFMIFMTILGIECHVVSGSAENSEGKWDDHAWNIIKIDGTYRHVDLAFDNPYPKNYLQISHRYFNVSDEVMDKDHSWRLDYYPLCR